MTATKTKPQTSLTPAQARILHALAKAANGLTREKLEEKIKFGVDSKNLGPITAESLASHPDSLIGLGLVEVQIDVDDETTKYHATKEGKRLAGDVSVKPRITAEEKVDVDALDDAVLASRVNKAYGLELYTKADLKEIREHLDENDVLHDQADDESLLRQIANRRKQGAYKPKFDPKYPKWYKEYLKSNKFAKLRKRAIEFYEGCTLNGETEVEDETKFVVVHRRFANSKGESVIGEETVADLIVLAPETYQRVYKLLPMVPVQDLS